MTPAEAASTGAKSLVSGMHSPPANLPELAECSAETGMPAVDPIATWAGAVIERL